MIPIEAEGHVDVSPHTSLSPPAVDASAAITTAEDPVLDEVLAGLRDRPKHLPCKLFYDQRGSELFDRICDLPEYYPTRTETGILTQHVKEIVQRIGEGALLIEYGSGSSVKTRILLEHLVSPAGYVPIDVSGEHLEATARTLAADFPDCPVFPITADYTRPIELPADLLASATRRIAFFPGSTIGNFTRLEAEGFLRRAADLVGPEGGLIIGVDLEKDSAVLEAAYNDAAGVTAEFNLNMLRVINQRYGANFELKAFDHRAIYNRSAGRIEMHLIANRSTLVRIAGEAFTFRAGECIVTEHSHKYRLEQFADLARRSGFMSDRVWCDVNRWFSVHFLSTVDDDAHHSGTC